MTSTRNHRSETFDKAEAICSNAAVSFRKVEPSEKLKAYMDTLLGLQKEKEMKEDPRLCRQSICTASLKARRSNENVMVIPAKKGRSGNTVNNPSRKPARQPIAASAWI